MIVYKVEDAPIHFIHKEMLKRNFSRKIIYSKDRATLELLLKNAGVFLIHDNSCTFYVPQF